MPLPVAPSTIQSARASQHARTISPPYSGTRSSGEATDCGMAEQALPTQGKAVEAAVTLSSLVWKLPVVLG